MKPISGELNYMLSNVQKQLQARFDQTLSAENRRTITDFLYSLITEEYDEILPFLKLIARLEHANDRETSTGIFNTIYAVRAVKQVDFSDVSYEALAHSIEKLGIKDKECVKVRITESFLSKKGLGGREAKEDRPSRS